LGVKENWWRFNYHAIRLGFIPVTKRALLLSSRVEGEIPNIRPIMLAPVHRTSADVFALSHVTREFISFVSTDSFGHNGVINFIQKKVTAAMGTVIWQEGGIGNPRKRAVALAKDVEDRLDRRLITAVFTQGEYQYSSVKSVEDGLLGLLKRYEVRHLKQKGHELRIPIVPVGIEYDRRGKGLEQSAVGKWISKWIPFTPNWTIPAVRTKITVRFGTPHYFEGQSSRALTEVVMREAAALSNIPYEVDGGSVVGRKIDDVANA
jgi:1-acyl-sn-glycerol-3-phosphate acyltransferase